jgi:hypothetical protein
MGSNRHHASGANPMMSLHRTLRRVLSATATLIAAPLYRRLRLGRWLTQYCRKGLGVRRSVVTVAARQGKRAERHIVAISRSGNSIGVSCVESMILEKPEELRARLCAVLALVACAPLEELHLVAEISDGESSGPGLISFCSRDPRAILIPDHLFVCSRGYEEYRRLAHGNRTAWNQRGDRIVWRGSTTGAGTIAKDRLLVDDPELLPRVRLCLELRGAGDTDVKISGVAQSSNAALDKDRLASAGILGEPISPIAWHTFKFAIDIDGNSNAWSNLFTRLLMGCCVLKVASPSGYRQWYYGDIEPWKHYVPVKADLSDLRSQIMWCRSNLEECRRIAASGQAFAMARDYETEIASGIRRVCEALKSGTLCADLAS